MPIDPRIAMGFQPTVQLESPLNQYAKYQQIESGQQANELAKMHMQEYQRGLQEQEGLRNYLAGVSDINAPGVDIGALRHGQAGAAFAKQLAERSKDLATLKKTQAETESSQFDLGRKRLAAGYQAVSSAKSGADVMAALDEGVKLGYFSQKQADAQKAELAGLQTIPEFQKWQASKLQGFVSAEKQLDMSSPKPQQVTLADGTVKMVDVNPNSPTYKQVVQTFETGIRPGQAQDFRLRQQQMGMQARLQDPFNLTGAQDMFGGYPQAMPNALPGMAAGAPLPTAAMPTAPGGQPPLKAPVPQAVASDEPIVAGTGKVQVPKMSVQQAFKAGLTGDEFISTLPPEFKEQVRAIVEHRQMPSQNTKRGQQLMPLVSQADPTFDAKEYKTQSGFMTSLSNGKLSENVRSASTAIDHLSTLEKAAKALENKDTRVINTVQNYFDKEFGGTKVTDFEAVKKIVGDEINKAVIGGVGALADRQEIAKTLSAASSPAQLAGVVGKLKELMAGRMRAIESQYKGVVNKNDFYDRYTSPEVREALGVGNKKPETSVKTIVRTGTLNGRKVAQYSDGSSGYVD